MTFDYLNIYLNHDIWILVVIWVFAAFFFAPGIKNRINRQNKDEALYEEAASGCNFRAFVIMGLWYFTINLILSAMNRLFQHKFF